MLKLSFTKLGKTKTVKKVIDFENKVKVLDNIVYKTGQAVQTMNMLNNKCRTSFVKPEYLKKAKQANPRLYDIGCYNDNLALMLSSESDEVIRLEKESRSKLSDLVRPFDYAKLNSLYDLFVPQREKSSEQRFFSERSRISHINAQKEKKKESFQKQTIFLETRMVESNSGNKNCQSSFEIDNIQRDINTIITDSLTSQLETQKTQFVNEIDRLSREYYYADHMNAILVTAQTLPPNKKSILKNTNVLAPGMYKLHTDHNQARTSQLPQDSRKTNKRVSFSTGVIPTTSVSRPQLKSHPIGDRVMRNNSQGKKQEVEDQHRNVKLPKNKMSVTASFSTGVIPTTSVSRPQLKSNPQGDRVLRSNSRGKKLEVEEHRRNVKFLKNKISVTACNDSLNAKTVNVKSVSAMCAKCVMIDKHDLCVPKSVAKPLKKTVASESNKKPRNNVRKLHERFGKIYKWSYIKFTPSGYIWKPKSTQGNVNPNLIEIVLFIVDSGCSKHMTGNLKLLINFVEKFLGTVKFGNDQIAPILGYGDLVQGAVTIKRVYYVEGLNHNLFLVGQFCDVDLEVAFRKSTCFIRDLKGIDLLTGSRGSDLYSITLQSINSPNPICLMAKATSSQAWLWHRRLSHLNFDTINLLSKNDIMVGLPKLKFVKDHLCSSCELEKAKRKSFHTKLIPSSKRRLHLLHMDLSETAEDLAKPAYLTL
nr:retrovirus-related Pol polyprotein from transposon TNT 1-94 [Tanacetum cinerariifolium]